MDEKQDPYAGITWTGQLAQQTGFKEEVEAEEQEEQEGNKLDKIIFNKEHEG